MFLTQSQVNNCILQYTESACHPEFPGLLVNLAFKTMLIVDAFRRSDAVAHTEVGTDAASSSAVCCLPYSVVLDLLVEPLKNPSRARLQCASTQQRSQTYICVTLVALLLRLIGEKGNRVFCCCSGSGSRCSKEQAGLHMHLGPVSKLVVRPQFVSFVSCLFMIFQASNVQQG